MKSARCQSGFTLLELVVALALSALVSLIGAMALSAGTDYYSRSGLRLHYQANVKATEKTLRVEWKTRGKDVQLSAEAVMFDTATPVAALPFVGIARVRYACTGDRTAGYKLTHQTWSMLGRNEDNVASEPWVRDGRQGEAQIIDLLTGLSSCQFSALKNRRDNSGRSISEWVISWAGKERAPQLLRMKLTSDFGDLPHFVFVAERP